MEHTQSGVGQSGDQSLRHRQLIHYRKPQKDDNEKGTTSGSRLSGSKNRFDRRRRRKEQTRVMRSGSQVFLPRMILRNMPYNQSNNQCQVINTNKSKSSLIRLLLSDWFHVLLRIKIHYSIFMLLGLWLGIILFFAVLYVKIDTAYDQENCGLGKPPNPISFPAAFAFSLETCTTVGYGLPGNSNAYFEANCTGIQMIVFFQMACSMLFNAFLFAFFYSQLSKSERRSLQLVFSDKLCVNVSKDGRVCASVQCYDIDSAFPVVEAHARMYLLDHKLQMNPLRLTHPDDNLGGMLYPSIPQKIMHHIDHHSALAPTRSMPLLAASRFYSGFPLRSGDSQNADRPEIVCPVCGESFGTYERLASHVRFNQMVERQENYPIKDSHQGFEMPDITKSPLTLQEVTDHIETTMSEIVVVVEAIDPQLSGTFQANQSYKYEDIVFGADHEICTSVTPDNKISVDMKKFHQIQCDNANARTANGSCSPPSSFASSSDKEDSLYGKNSSMGNKNMPFSQPQTTRTTVSFEEDGHIPVCIESRTMIEEEKKVEETSTTTVRLSESISERLDV